ncbi:MAG: hypothetical protein HHJ11_17040 [Phycicoccus sp.]|nr:hypothetical protein [Phycicoccus sp.]NMM32853.1 hypothetical protein [Phycicoccus sp.]
MDSNALDQLLSEVNGSAPMSVTLAPAEGSEVAQARRVSENDWRLTLAGTQSLADRLEAVIDAVPDAAMCSCETVVRLGPDLVRLELGCRGPHLLTSLLDTVIADHAARHPQAHLQAMLRVDDSMRPRRIDLLMPSGRASHGHALQETFGLVPAQAV